MGSDGLPPLLRESHKRPDNFKEKVKEYNVKKLAVDLSKYMHKAAHAGCNMFHVVPPVPILTIFPILEWLINLADDAGVGLVWVIDGYVPYSKDRSSRAEAKAKLQQLYNNPDPSNFSKVQKLRKQCVEQREDMIADAIQFLQTKNQEVIGAICESDHQMVYLEQTGLVDGIITDDCDIFVQGGKLH